MRNLDMRIGEFARRSGVPAATLRAWQRRYGVLDPTRTAGGHRIYTSADLNRVRMLVTQMQDGLSISAAAKASLARPEPADPDNIDAIGVQLWAAIDTFDAARLKRLVAAAAGQWGVAAALDAVVVPALRRLGQEWRAAPRNVARENFATTVLRSQCVNYLTASTNGMGSCLAFCPEGELHDLGMVMAAAALAEAGWQPIVLGARTPWLSIEALLADLRPALVLVGAQLRPPVIRLLDRWQQPATSPVLIGGAGFRPDDAERLGASFHNGPLMLIGNAADQAKRNGITRSRDTSHLPLRDPAAP